MKQPCPKCQSQNTYSDGPEMACLMCGKRWPINGQKPTTIYQVTGRERMAQKEKSPSGKKGTCSNCGREKYIADKNGHCGTCHTAVAGLDPGSSAYAAALDTIKDRINAPGFKTRPAKQRKVDRKPARKAKSIEPAEGKSGTSKRKFKSARKPSSSDFLKHNVPHKAQIGQVRHHGVVGNVAVIELMATQREFHLAEAAKLCQAIDLLSA
jgi:hypothetical protein